MDLIIRIAVMVMAIAAFLCIVMMLEDKYNEIKLRKKLQKPTIINAFLRDAIDQE